MVLKNKRVLRIILAYAAAVAIIIATIFASMALIVNKLGDELYTVRSSWVYVLSTLGAISVAVLLYPRPMEDEDDYAEAEEKVEDAPEAKGEAYVMPEIDESAYPELFGRHESVEEVKENISYPDIKKIISEQKAEADLSQEIVDTKTAWDEFVGTKSEESQTTDIYADIPTELPEGYVPNYEAAEEEPADEEPEEEEVYSSTWKWLVAKIAAVVILCSLAVFMPQNMMTVYTEEGIVKYSLFGVTEYKYAEADHYTVGVKLSGDVSLKVYFDGAEFELVFSGQLESAKFSDRFTSPHSYAAYCDRLMKHAGVDKNIGNLTSLTGVPEEQYSYVNEITEGYLDANK